MGLPRLRRELRRFLAEDIGAGDVTGALLPAGAAARALVVSRQAGVAAGVAFAREIFAMGGCRVSVRTGDGERMGPGQTVMEVAGNARRMLARERTALNLLSRMSGIATQTDALAAKLPHGTELLSTRKTAPGLRAFDKEAVRIGGGGRHRSGLDEAVMLKDNHLAVGPPVGELIRRARGRGHRRVEVEAETAGDAVAAARGGAAIIMLDNFTPGGISRTIRELDRLGLRARVKLEASGGITERNIGRYAATGVDMISVGSITHSVRGIDMSLEVQAAQ